MDPTPTNSDDSLNGGTTTTNTTLNESPLNSKTALSDISPHDLIPSTSVSNHHHTIAQSIHEEAPLPSGNSPQKEARGRPSSLAPHNEASRYQLVFGVDDSSSEASFTDSPQLSHNSSGRSFPSQQQQQRQQQQNSGDPKFDDVASSGGEKSTMASLQVDGDANGDAIRAGNNNKELVSDLNAASVVSDTTEFISTSESESPDSTHSGSAHVNQKFSSTDSSGCQTKPSSSNDKERDSGDDVGNLPSEQHDIAISPLSHSDSDSQELELDDIKLRSRSSSPGDIKQKVHPLSLLTSDSELGDSPPPERPPYSPVLNTSGDEESGSDKQTLFLSPSSSLPSPLLSPSSEEPPIMSVMFGGMTYLGSASVDAPISEIEANRKMHILKEQATGTEPIPVVLSIPMTNHGSVTLKDPKTEMPMANYPIKTILFCARGNAEVLLDCFCLNVKNKQSGMYQCHVFRCEDMDECDRIFQAIGKAFTTRTFTPTSVPPLTGDNIRQDFMVSLDLHEEDGKGSYSPVPMDKDCFKLKQNTKKKVILSVSQSQSKRPIIITRCFGLLVSPGKDVPGTEMNLLDNMNPTSHPGHSFSVTGIWDTGISFLDSLNEETPKSIKFQFLTVAADLILEAVTEPIRFKREVKVLVYKRGLSYDILNQLSSINKPKKRQGPMDKLLYTLKLRKSEETSTKKCQYSLDELRPAHELRESPSAGEAGDTTPSPTQKEKKKQGSVSGGGPSAGAKKDLDEAEDSDNDESDVVVSGWGDVEGMREDLLKDWGDIFERWDGRDRVRPNKVIKLCRKGIPRPLRCQVWQMLTGAAHDPQLAEAYRLLLSKESPTENVINWDIKRTYVGHGYFQEPANRDALYKICKAYSVYDEEVGYCQGFSFMAAVLLLQKMPEETAFSVLVKMMYTYGHRNIFKANFSDLHLMFYQLDKLMEEYLPDLFQHMQANRIETHMYASQWFLTLYTAKFPLSIVFRILDIYLCESIGAIFKVALSLLKIARKELMLLDFEGILGYFRVSLPKKFQSEEDCELLFDTMFTFKINEKKLSKLQKDYQSFLEQQAQLEDPVVKLERDNKQLRDLIHRLEQENDNLAQDLVGSKIKLREEMDKLEERIDTLSKEARNNKTLYESSQATNNELREELKQAKVEFQKIMIKLTEERQQHEGAIAEYKQVFTRLDEGHEKQKDELKQELLEVKASLGSDDETTDRPTSLSSEQRLRNLELELAQTKLALVESQCKNQELEHRVSELTVAKSKRWYDNVKDFANKKK